jgi:hypothetical protein
VDTFLHQNAVDLKWPAGIPVHGGERVTDKLTRLMDVVGTLARQPAIELVRCAQRYLHARFWPNYLSSHVSAAACAPNLFASERRHSEQPICEMP